MINSEKDTLHILSDVALKAYDKVKELIEKIFSLIKSNSQHNDFKEDFYKSYIDFANKLKLEGYDFECYSYMSICEMYFRLIDRPDVLIAHESFFIDLFGAFDELLFYKINKPNEYVEKYNEFLQYYGKMQEYYYLNLAIPSENYDEEVLNEITSYLAGDI